MRRMQHKAIGGSHRLAGSASGFGTDLYIWSRLTATDGSTKKHDSAGRGDAFNIDGTGKGF